MSSVNFDIKTGLSIDGVKVVDNRDAGWTAATGTASKATFATHTSQDISAAPTEAEVQAIDDHLVVLSQHIKAIVDLLIAHGLAGA